MTSKLNEIDPKYRVQLYPPVRSARQIPELRMQMQKMTVPMGPVHELEFARDMTEMPDTTPRDSMYAAGVRTQWVCEAVTEAELWFVSEEMVDIIQDAAPTVPTDIVLHRDTLIHESGLAVFAKPIRSISAEGLPMYVSAICWHPFQLRLPWMTEFVPAVGFGMWRCVDPSVPLEDDDQFGRMFREASEDAPEAVWCWLGRTDWAFGDELNELDRMTSGELFDETTMASMQHDRQVMMTLWSLATQPTVIDHERVQADRPARRRIERKTGSPAADVLVLKLRGEGATSTPGDAQAGTERAHDKRWMVRAHWRNQAYGPGRSQRKLILVPPHIKGPEGAPLVEKPHVWTLD